MIDHEGSLTDKTKCLLITTAHQYRIVIKQRKKLTNNNPSSLCRFLPVLVNLYTEAREGYSFLDPILPQFLSTAVLGQEYFYDQMYFYPQIPKPLVIVFCCCCCFLFCFVLFVCFFVCLFVCCFVWFFVVVLCGD